MAFDFSGDSVRMILQDFMLAGGALMGAFLGIRRVYRMARNVETLVASVESEREGRGEVKKALEAHIADEQKHRDRTDDLIKDLAAGQNEILREIRPNGGSSIKDVVNQVQRDVAVLTQWKDDVNYPARRP